MADDTYTSTPQRPTFLTVLCILTFIGSGYQLISLLFGMLGAPILKSLAHNTVQINMTNEILALVAALLCLIGAIRMWRLHRHGYWLYLLGIIISIIVVIVSFKTVAPIMHRAFSSQQLSEFGDKSRKMIQMGGKITMWMSLVGQILVDIVFAILYTVNYKHLVRN